MTVLVPLDGSTAAERSLAIARALARRLRTEMVLVRFAWDVGEDEALGYLDGVIGRFGLSIETPTRAAFRRPPDGMADLVAAYADPIVCLASSGRRGPGHVALGSTSEEMIATAAAPVVACGPKVRGESLLYERLGLCVDASTHETAAVQFCAHWARLLGAAVDVATVRSEDERPVSRFHPASAAQLDAAVALLRANDVDAEPHVLAEVQPARRLAAFAREAHLGLLIAAKRSGPAGIAREVLGSTTMSLIRQAPCPVLLPPSH